MRTNLEKYNYYKKLIDDHYNNQLPEIDFKVVYIRQMVKIEKWTVDHIRYNHGFYNLERPTRVQVNAIKEFYDNLPDFDDNKILIHLKRMSDSGKWSTACKYVDLLDEDNTQVSFYRDPLEKAANEGSEKYVAKEGEINCAYCRKRLLKKRLLSMKYLLDNTQTAVKQTSIAVSSVEYMIKWGMRDKL